MRTLLKFARSGLHSFDLAAPGKGKHRTPFLRGYMRKIPLLAISSIALFAGYATLLVPVATSAQTPGIIEPTRTLEPGISVERQLGAKQFHTYWFAVEKGLQYRAVIKPRGVQLELRAYAPDSTWLGDIFLRNDSARTLDILSESGGAHRLEVRWGAGDSTAGTYTLRFDQRPAAEAAAARVELDEATRWVKANAHPLRAVTAGNGFTDLMPLKQILSGARVVGLGEATHGTREFFQVKHRLLEFLVRELGFTVFALETSQTAAHAINDFVLYGKADRAKVLARQGFFNWDTEEMGATLDWMREYNRSVPEARKVRFAGFDFQYNPGARVVIGNYLSRVAPERAAATDSMLITLSESADSTRPDFIRYYSLSDTAKAPLVTSVNELLGYLVLNRSNFLKKTSVAQYDSALQSVRMLAQLADTHIRPGFEQHIAESGVATRDRYMAENIAALIESLPLGTKMVLSSHNEHLRRDPYNMGYYLSEAYGSSYYALGLAFGQGGFQALSITDKSPFPLRPFTVGPGLQDAADWFLARAVGGDYFVDFRRSEKDGPASAWLTRAHQLRSIGNGYLPSNPSGYYRDPVTLGKSYDGIIFIARTTRARPNPTVLR